jgi:S-adenosylmethionine:tRNA ribosyltransferase-isomerase
VRTAQLEYALPEALIAQTPAEPRDSARLLVYERATGAIRHRVFRDLPDELRGDDLVVVNDTRVLPARVHLRRRSGGAVELLVLEQREGGGVEAIARPYRRLRAGDELSAGGFRLRVTELLGEGRLLLEPSGPLTVEQGLAAIGEVPLPPYIRTPPADRSDYQTVYARRAESAAAPTAGLHFTPQLWRRVRERFEVVEVTLAVGLDTFRPVAVDDLSDHALHSERYRVEPAAHDAIGRALAGGRRVVAVGTTSVRVLETVFGDPAGPAAGRTRLFITPGHRFRATGALVTNFHLPRSTLLAMVMAFAGEEETLRVYREAVAERYRFYSFGDAMLIL